MERISITVFHSVRSGLQIFPNTGSLAGAPSGLSGYSYS
ncbi:Uncharacterized protein dnm_065200 [Desulfonema magnum]|uniref:Uncharacterized protein n=1 Tax=Desulfonema magnum TaxID=45655 RepID=A0A975BSL4_9BACT|nr:Uncharacterized protein dnm_065200 [Desulfonema magnum]